MASIRLKSAREIETMAEAGQVVADTLLLLRANAAPGVTTRHLNDLAEAYIHRRGAVSSYPEVGFDGVVCTSINEQVVHGIPGGRVLAAGDLLSLDIAVIYNGFHADAALTFGVGPLSPQARHLETVTERALALGISLATSGRHLHEIGAAIQLHVEREGCSVVRGLVGHGIGRSMWEEPQVPNYRQDTRGPILRPGMVFTIEPMVNLGHADTRTLADQWTIVTRDRKLSAHFEHTIVVTEQGPRILTMPSDRAAVWGMVPPASSAGLRVASSI